MADPIPRPNREDPPRVACFATQGRGSGDEARILALLEALDPQLVPFERAGRIRSAIRLLRQLNALDPDLVVMEGTGIAGGVAVIAGRLLRERPYVVSSGDAVGPFLGLESKLLALVGTVYERLLCGLSAGFIGWSPYLVGRALTYKAPRAMTAPNWSGFSDQHERRPAMRQTLGIPDNAVVFGLVGSLNWTRRVEYCYGLEVVEAVLRISRDDVYVLIVGDGDGRAHLEERAGAKLGRTVLITGKVRREDVPAYLAAFDVASLPQSVDQVGSFRYTTKLSEYLAARVAIVTGQIPLAYDLDGDWMWRLPGDAPWDERYISALADLMAGVRLKDVDRRRSTNYHAALFSRRRQQRQVQLFILDLLARARDVRPVVS